MFAVYLFSFGQIKCHKVRINRFFTNLAAPTSLYNVNIAFAVRS
ncbi:hypothetical protein PAGA_b0003 [Pseudoalteromonas agarivorans DSM 14585]|uniref:Uncharacterized protein n=1 Tax=Pseudoalteromonas agarivorans DSM 14585 TaxID=1312369 RepID=A0ACA8E1I6_9GAMM|nr:hypothetical protein PAGA_b0003 [Pseudoalteromonas agarivorans DSM 14585]